MEISEKQYITSSTTNKELDVYSYVIIDIQFAQTISLKWKILQKLIEKK